MSCLQRSCEAMLLEISDIQLVTYADYNTVRLSVEPVCVPVCVNSAGGMAGVSAGSYQCVTERGTMRRIDAKPTATLQVYSAFYSPHSSKRRKIFLSLPLCLSLRSHCILWSVLLFKCSYSPFRRRVTFKPTVTMATPICI